VDEGVRRVFLNDLYATLPDEADRTRALHLLRALAYARGRGLPWRQLWPTVANALAAEDGTPHTYGDGDVAWLLNSRLSAYLVADLADDTTVYRLCHQALVTMLREDWQIFRIFDEARLLTMSPVSPHFTGSPEVWRILGMDDQS
jgi:hypothetical protein